MSLPRAEADERAEDDEEEDMQNAPEIESKDDPVPGRA
jgi:hypothetical protein